MAGSDGDLPDLLREGVVGVKAFMIHSGVDEFPAVTGTHTFLSHYNSLVRSLIVCLSVTLRIQV